jgi:hypothetical protein
VGGVRLPDFGFEDGAWDADRWDRDGLCVDAEAVEVVLFDVVDAPAELLEVVDAPADGAWLAGSDPCCEAFEAPCRRCVR